MLRDRQRACILVLLLTGAPFAAAYQFSLCSAQGGACQSYRACSNLTQWERIWTGIAAGIENTARIFDPPVCPPRRMSEVVRIDFDTAAAPGWNMFDAVRVTGMLQLSPGDIIPDANGTSKVIYVPLPGAHGIDIFDVQVSDCLAYGSSTPVTVSLPAPARPFVSPQRCCSVCFIRAFV